MGMKPNANVVPGRRNAKSNQYGCVLRCCLLCTLSTAVICDARLLARHYILSVDKAEMHTILEGKV
jgi:hypothetical protein